jgi:hypothetical protein
VFAPPPPPPDPSDTLEPVSQKLKARIYIDATVSMEGFVVPGTSTNYAQILQPLETAVVSGWRDAQVEFYKFGAQVSSLPGRTYLKATQRDFYQDSDIKKKTLIEEVIDSDDTGGLTVVVSDLFETDADVTLLMTKLKEKYLQKNLAVGVLGIKSQYDGTVYDAGINAYAFSYRSDENPDSFRPFYVLILGKHADVAHYFEQLKSSVLSSFVPEAEFVIFSRHLVNPLSSFEEASMDSIDKIVEVGNLIKPDNQDNRLKQFLIRGNPKTAAFIATLKYTSLPYTMSFNPTELEPEVIAHLCQSNTLVESLEAKRSFVIEQITLSDAGITFQAKLTPTLLSSNGIYCYEVILRPKASAYQMPDWFSAWNMDTTQEGFKTLNLNRLLSGLWRATVQIHQPKIAKFYCYIKKG